MLFSPKIAQTCIQIACKFQTVSVEPFCFSPINVLYTIKARHSVDDDFEYYARFGVEISMVKILYNILE